MIQNRHARTKLRRYPLWARSLLILTGVFIVGSALALVVGNESVLPTGQAGASVFARQGEPAVGPSGLFTEIQIADDGTKHLVPLNWVKYGGQPKDGIPSIDQPKFADAAGWDELNYRELGLVIGIEVDGVRRAYPFQILDWHEIVNDTINGRPILITYCPLCSTGIAFEREIDGVEVEFGVSGQLYNSDLLMYDRESDSLWSQISGTAVIGELTGNQLSMYPTEIMTWQDWKNAYPESQVLTRDTGFERSYDAYAYGDYEVSPLIQFPVRNRDKRAFEKEPVTGVLVGSDYYGAYVDFDVRNHGPVNDNLGGVPLLVVADPDAGNNIVVFDRTVANQELTFQTSDGHLVDEQTGSTWNFAGLAIDGELAGLSLTSIIPVKGFWFGWVAFHPDTALWTAQDE